MGLTLGKSFDRALNMRLPFLDGNYNIGVFFSKRSSFLLFRVDADYPRESVSRGIKINMFKNLESSKFCETFLKLHNYRGENLDILHQFDSIKDEYYSELTFIFNEMITLSKIDHGDKTFYDTLSLYGFTLSAYVNEFIFVIAERQNIISKLKKKVVRTTALQISTTAAIALLNEFHEDYRTGGQEGSKVTFPSDETIKLT